MPTREDELEAFKSRINLSAYAAARGYELDRRTSSRNSVAMRHPEGDKIIIGMGADRHWVYYSVKNPGDHGSIIDFVQNRRGMNLGQARRELRPWLDTPATPLPPGPSGGPSTFFPPPESYAERVEPVVRDTEEVRRRLADMRPAGGHHPYLVDRRAIPPDLLASPRLQGRILTDRHDNAVFPHWDEKGLCGYEIKNRDFTGFASGGSKGLWAVGKQVGDDRVVVAETALDALSYAALHGGDGARLVSIAGTMNPQQPALLRRAMDNLPPGSAVIAAVDHDDGGDAIAEQIEAVFEGLGRSDLSYRRHSPPTAGQDWNDVLRDLGVPPRPAADPQPT
jgi:hypothetical protein